VPDLRGMDATYRDVPFRQHQRRGYAVSVLLNRLDRIGGRVASEELRRALSKKDRLHLSEDELLNQLRHEELAGRVRSFTYFSVVSPSEVSSRNGVGA
jgi:hypothetical protein